jgi:hypothetical protein
MAARLGRAAKAGNTTDLMGGDPWLKRIRQWRKNDHPEHQWA